MGASRKLQGEIDRVLKKVQEGVDVFESIWNKVYDTENMNQKEKFEADLKKEIKKLQRYRDQIKTWLQSSEIKDKRALMDARKQIEREMERFKICEKETKTKAFSKEGLVQQPKTDPKEKAKSETRDWLNTVVSDLESQIDSFEAELEALSVKKGKTRPPRSTHLEASITRNKAHIMKLELILRLLDNDELSPEQVNDVKDFLEDYVERNQDDFEEFSDVDELYSTLPLDKVESLEDRVAIGTSALVKGVGSLPTASTVLGLKSSISGSATQPSSVSAATPSQGASPQDQTDETTSQDSNSDLVSKTPLSKVGMTVSAGFSTTHGTASVTGPVPNLLSVTGSLGLRGMPSAATAPAVLPNPGSIRVPIENSSTTTSVTHATNLKEDNVNLLSRRPSPAPSEIGMGKGVGRSSLVGSVSTSAPINSLSSVSIAAIPGSGALGTMSMASDTAKRNSQGADDKSGTTNLPKSLLSPLNNKLLLQQITKSSDAIGSTDASNTGEGTLTGGRVFSASAISGVQWRPQTANLFHNQNETVQIRGRTELPPDHREKYLQRLLQVQQQGASNHFNMSHLSGTSQKQFLAQQSSLLQQLNSQSSSLSSFGLGIPPPGLSHVPSISQQQTNSVQQLSQQSTHSSAPKDIEIGQVKIEEQQLLSNSAEDLMDEPSVDSALNSVPIEDDMKPSYTAASNPTADANLLPRETDLSPGQPLQSNQTASNLGVIGRRSALDLGKVSDNIVEPVTHHAGVFEHNLQMLEAAYYRLPQPKDSERPKAYIPRHPTVTPSSYPQVPLPIFDKPAFWERLSLENVGADTLFYTFYYQQNSYQQYLAARELKRQSWRYHKKYNTWFQRHEEPKITTDDYEQGTYVYFDFHITDDGLQHGWCQRIKTDFRFEYNYLEDELVV